MKAKVHAVSIDGTTHLVMAQTKAGAIRDVVDHLTDNLRKRAIADLATGEQIYNAGRDGSSIIGDGRFKNTADLNQLPLTGIPETEGGVA